MGDEVRDELEPVGGAIEDVCIGQGDENPASQLGEGGLGDDSGDAPACGVSTRPPDAAVDFDSHLGIRPGKVCPEGSGLTRPKPFLLLVGGPGVPHRQHELALKGQARERHQPLVGKRFFQMTGHRARSR